MLELPGVKTLLVVAVLLTELVGVASIISSSYWLFGVVTGSACAERLPYGPSGASSSGYLSTKYKDVTHDSWLQDVYVNNEWSFRVYWYFNTTMTMRQRFANAVSSGESVSYIIDQNTGTTITQNGVWWFSKQAGITASAFDASSTTYYFSSDSGAWGAGTGAVDGSSSSFVTNTSFWGQANVGHSSLDSSCLTVYKAGVGTSVTKLVSRLYTNGMTLTSYPTTAPTAAPTIAPTLAPTHPTRAPTASPTSRPTTQAPTASPTPAPALPDMGSVFAITTATQCAEALPYGPTAGLQVPASEGAFFDTRKRDVKHTGFVQVVTTDGAREDFRVYYHFGTCKTLRHRMLDAVRQGEPVNYTVVVSGSTSRISYRDSRWWFSSSAALSSAHFDAARGGRAFSANNGVWGAGSGDVDGSLYNTLLWGHGVQLSTDAVDCGRVYRYGATSSTEPGMVSYLYFTGEAPSTTTADQSNDTMPLHLPFLARVLILATAILVMVLSAYTIHRIRRRIRRQAELDVENPGAGRRQGRRRGQRRPALPVQPQQVDDTPGIVSGVDECVSSMHATGVDDEAPQPLAWPVAAVTWDDQPAVQGDPSVPLGLPPELDVAGGGQDLHSEPSTPTLAPGAAEDGGEEEPVASDSRSAGRRSSVLRSLQHLHLHSPTAGGGITRVSSPTVSPMFRGGGGGAEGGEGEMEQEEGGAEALDSDADMVCDFCSERDKAAAFVPCGHKACTECALARVGGRCPVCKTKVKKIKRLFR